MAERMSNVGYIEPVATANCQALRKQLRSDARKKAANSSLSSALFPVPAPAADTPPAEGLRVSARRNEPRELIPFLTSCRNKDATFE